MTIGETIRIEGGRVLATLIRFTGDIGLAEDALQDATIVALERWATDRLPANPAAWLTAVARNKALDRIRRDARRRDKEIEAHYERPLEMEEDDSLRLIFTCAHPALSMEARIGLTLRLVGGLTTSEIAGLFLVPEATVGQRISRAKKKVALARIPYRVPSPHELPDRLAGVLAVIYLIFTTGHHAFEGPLDSRFDLAAEAIRLGRLLVGLMPDEPEALGLLALMLATTARHRARLDEHGDIVLLADQDRSRWDVKAINEASLLIEKALRRRRVGPYQIQGAIACLHGQARSDAETDWRQISDLYRFLESFNDGPVIRVNRAVAESKVFGPEAGLELLEGISGVDSWHLYWSTRADFLRQLGREAEAAAAYRSALAMNMNDADRRFLERRLASLSLA
ncbi:MAG TPA: sigma-70 family RNA polymerase sigma factor [Acidimicrobiia bacterium]|nr:sigma-70 family RNA polymerase sigma factor [Acidimicrobiia bacterium]